ncbi:MAG: UDP-N-acetylglucosamine 2-epimerase (non-hydrolyzing) [Gemmatimonadetes bacterium]|nr:MAG: UDP-N-acetylglucosamine 2-epimerase (non-hydrolyzing) [Gemmatimonadota bacterium]PYO76196.1 MAG: UDP-N-acetylglucosamine 2-epimerase (non-hydrolyzing) [Gemmatimonadota bacterium]
MKLLHVVGARPNFPKLAPVHRAGRQQGIDQVVVHTGQHYDDAMSDAFFRDLGIAPPDVNLAVGSDTHAVQTARILERIEPVLVKERPDWMVVYGDVNSTMAAALVASKLGIRIAHVEAGLRSFDRTMPEEINRVVTDRLANLLLTPSRDADAQLRLEGEPENRIAFVGNVMIDSLFYALPAARTTGFRAKLGLNGSAVVVTLHRPSNVDDPRRIRALAAVLSEIALERPVVFPAHPRTQRRLESAGLRMDRVRLLEPVGYLEMLDLVENAFAVITDSGGLQEETTALGVPCLTVRPNTERPITITEGTNRLVPEPGDIVAEIRQLRRPSVAPRPEGWDGRAGERVILALANHL